MRAYIGVQRREERDGSETYAIQVLDEPCQIFVLQVCDGVSVLFFAKEVVELLVKVWRSSIEVVELL